MTVGKKNSKPENVDTFERDQSKPFVFFVILVSLFIGLVALFEGFRRLSGRGFDGEDLVVMLFGIFLCSFALRYRWYAQNPAVEVSHRKILVRRLLLPSHQISTGDVTKIESQLHKIRPRRYYLGYHIIEYVTIAHRKGTVTRFIAPQFFSNEELLDSLQLKTGVQVERLPMVDRKP